MEQKTSLWKSALAYGLYIGLAQIIYSVILYILGQSFNQTLGYVSFLIIIVGIIWAQLDYRKQQGDMLTYGQGVGLATALMIFAGVLGAIYTVLLYKVIDPGLYDQYLLFYEEKATAKMMEQGLGEDQMAQALEMTKKFQTPVIMAITAVISSVIAGLVVGLITSIFIKKTPSEEIVE